MDGQRFRSYCIGTLCKWSDRYSTFNFKFITMGDLSEGGLPLATGVRTNYAFHKSAIGLAESLGPKTEINYVPQKTSWLVNCMYSAGSVGIDNAGIVEIACTE